MKKSSGRVRGRPYDGEDPLLVEKLKQIAACLVDLQEARIEADYDRPKVWSRSRVGIKVKDVKVAFDNVEAIREQPIFQDYLLSLLSLPGPERWDDEP